MADLMPVNQDALGQEDGVGRSKDNDHFETSYFFVGVGVV